MRGLERQAALLSALLPLERKAAGVKLVKTKEAFDHYQGVELQKSMSYCVAVKSAMAGHSIKLDRKTSGCIGSTRVLGLMEAGEEYFSGREATEWLGLYKDCETAAKIAREAPICKNETYGVIVKPLEAFEDEPDVVLIAAKPRTLMRIMQGYSYEYGVCRNLHMCGNQAVCIECTVTPYIDRQINVSALCAGTRFHAGWKEEEMMVGIPYELLDGTINGIWKTVNPIEMDDRKKEIEEALANLREEGPQIRYGQTYFWKAEQV